MDEEEKEGSKRGVLLFLKNVIFFLGGVFFIRGEIW